MAQIGSNGSIKGVVLNKANNVPLNDVQLNLYNTKLQTTTNIDGYFIISDVPSGNWILKISGSAIKNDSMSVIVLEGKVTDLGKIFVSTNEQVVENSEIPTISIEENTSQDDENSSAASQSSVGFYAGNQDPFLYTASIVFGPYRFKPRGYDNSDVEINGIPLQDLESGYAATSLIGGLNEVMRDRSIAYGLKPSEYSFGTIKGSTYISATAADQRPCTNFSYLLSNGTIHNRIMLTHSSGVNKNGWAYSLSGSKRWAQEGYVPGAFFDAYSFYGAVSKLTNNGQFNFTVIGAPSKRGKATSETGDTYEIAGSHYYNASWGYQNGEKRNALVANSFQPIAVANYTYKPTDKTRWNFAIGYEFGKRENSNIDYYNGFSPNPTYYKNMPNNYINGILNPNAGIASVVEAQYKAHPEMLQVQWDNMYNNNYTNVETIYDVNGIQGNNITGRRSIHIVENAVDNMKKLSFNTNIAHVINDNITFTGGFMAISQNDEYYKQVDDLLGGDFFVNYNQFAAQSTLSNPLYVQNNLNAPNQIIKKGDKYGYDYMLRALQTKGFGQSLFSYNHFDFFVAVEGGLISFSREGFMRNGLFPDNSYGKSATHSFTTYKFKGGLTYNLNPKNSVYLHTAYFSDAPKIDYTYISDKGRDYIVNDAKAYNTKSFELGYLFKSSNINCRLTGYATDVTGNTIIKRFWNDDPEFQSFVNFVMQNVSTRSIGAEFVAGVKLSKQLSMSAVMALGQSFYINDPNISVYLDNSPVMTPSKREVYIKNYYLGVGPQSINSIAFKYSIRNYWHANINFNYIARNFVEINPERRTQQAIDMVVINSKQWNGILNQEKLPDAFTVDLSIGKSFNVAKYMKLSKNMSIINFNLGVNNVLNNTNIKTAGFEQLRYDFSYHNAEKFPNKYIYGYGTNFYITIGFKF